MDIELKDIGIINGFQTFEVIDKDTNQVIGYNKSLPDTEDVGVGN
jgi:hypothetical protein